MVCEGVAVIKGEWSIGVMSHDPIHHSITPPLHWLRFACPVPTTSPRRVFAVHRHQFDLVTAFDVLEHLPEHEVLPALREMAACRGGIFSIATAPEPHPVAGPEPAPTVRPLDWWHDRIREGRRGVRDGAAGGMCMAAGGRKTSFEKITGLESLCYAQNQCRLV